MTRKKFFEKERKELYKLFTITILIIGQINIENIKIKLALRFPDFLNHKLLKPLNP